MLAYELVLEQQDGVTARYPVPRNGLTIGRFNECDIVLRSQLVSRRHARVFVDNGSLYAEDLGSSNGITVNKKQVKKVQLQEGDQLTVGTHTFTISRDTDLSDSSAVITSDKSTTLAESIVKEAKSARLSVLYKATKLIGTVLDLDELSTRLLETVFEAIPAKRGYILTTEDDADEPSIRAKLSRQGGAEAPPLSTTLVRHVVADKNAILTVDAQDDERFDTSDSIIGFSIHSAMCAPLWGRSEVVGAIYVDSGVEPKPFDNADLELLTAVGRVAGVAVENNRLYRESLENERLAAIGEATAGIGHCIKNIVTGIRGGSQFVDMAIEKEDLKYLEKGWPIMRRAIERMENLSLNMLEYSKDREPECRPTAIDRLVEEVIEMLGPRIDKYGIEVQFKPGEVGEIPVDGSQIFRLILNLLSNAIEALYNRDDARMTISTRRDDAGVYLTVADNGPGIATEVVQNLFEAFVSTKGSSGTGLGLACCSKVARAHGGEITVESTVGKGAEFRVFLPESPQIPAPGLDSTERSSVDSLDPLE